MHCELETKATPRAPGASLLRGQPVAVTLDDVRRVGRAILRPELATIAAVGPFEDDTTFAGIV